MDSTDGSSLEAQVASRPVARVESPWSEAATALVADMCTELTQRYRRPPSPFEPEEVSIPRTAMVVAWLEDRPAGCGALRRIDETTAEVKRMYVAPAARRRGVARCLLKKLEELALSFEYRRVILETGNLQPEALALYPAAGYQPIASYGRYADNPEAHCFEKWLA